MEKDDCSLVKRLKRHPYCLELGFHLTIWHCPEAPRIIGEKRLVNIHKYQGVDVFEFPFSFAG